MTSHDNKPTDKVTKLTLGQDRWRILWLLLVAALGFSAGSIWNLENPINSAFNTLYIELLLAALVLLCIWFLLWHDYQSRATIEKQFNALNKEVAQGENAKKALENAYTEVEEKVHERTRDLTEIKNELEESNALLNAIFQTMRAGILVMQKGRTFAYANRAFGEIWKLNSEEYQFECRRLLPRLYEKAENPDELCKLLEGISKDADENSHQLITLKDGRLLDFQTMAFLIAGKNVGNIHTFRDITELHSNQDRLQKTVSELETFKRALDFHAQVSICDMNDIISYVNDQLCETSGYQSNELLGNTHSLLNSNYHDANFFKEMWDTLNNGKVWRGEIRNKKKNGSFYWVTSTMVPFFDEKGDPTQYLAISADITNQKVYEDQLQRAKDAAESADRAKSEFLANISHEIRTPMNAVLGFSEILSSEIDDPRHREYLRLLTISGNTLLELINDLLDLSKIEAGKFSLQFAPLNLREVIQEIQNIFLIRAQEKRLQLLIDIDSNLPNEIIGDAIRIRQILFNLIGNAVKFTDEGYIKILVETEFIDRDNNTFTLLISIIDTGIGISKDNLSRIFDAFQQAEGQSLKKFGGTGLGLTITKRLVEMMDGTISVHSRSGQGSCFTLRIPQVNLPENNDFDALDSATPKVLSKIHFEPATILLADDDHWNRKMLTSYLRDSELTIIEAHNGNEVLEKANKFKPDLVIMDMMLPEANVQQLTGKIKDMEGLEHTPIFLLTGLNPEKAEQGNESAQVDAYLLKPIDRKQLFTLLRRHLKTTSSQTDNKDNSDKPIEQNKPSQKVLKNLNTVIKKLDSDLRPQLENLQRRMQTNAMLEFADAILDIGEGYDYAPLIALANEIKRRVDIFDVNGMRSALKEYSELIQTLKSYTQDTQPPEGN